MEKIINTTYKNLISPTELITIGREINSLYNPFLQDNVVWGLLEHTLPDNILCNIKKYKKDVLGHKIVNDIIMNYYHNERVIKYYLVKKYIMRSDEIALFEMNVDSSRIDMCRVNGKSIAYEIKTEFDSTFRLEKQIDDYSKIFEYVHVVTHKKHVEKVLKIIPEFCGIQTYNIKNNKCTFRSVRKASKSPNIDYLVQVRNLSSEDLRFILVQLGYKNLPSTRCEREEMLYKVCKPQKINSYFKLAVKNKFNQNWDFLCNNFEKIMPIDIQTFFHTNCDPKWIYHKDSSMV